MSQHDPVIGGTRSHDTATTGAPAVRPVSREVLLHELNLAIDSALNPVLPRGTPCALLDFPLHTNLGDSAIWLGELAWLARRGCEVVYTCDWRSYSRMQLRQRLPRKGCILFTGGGNLGDLYPTIERFRQRVILDFPDRRVIVMPQSVWFTDQAVRAQTKAVYDRHPDLVLLVRAARSLALARETFRAPSALCPDMAFALQSLARWRVRRDAPVWMLRRDAEAVRRRPEGAPAGAVHVDWPRSESGWQWPLLSWLQRPLVEHPRRLTAAAGLISRISRSLARQRVRQACRLISSDRVVVTDRLHGHILCLLMGIPHVLMDNSYGKVWNFYDTWTRSCPLVRWADSIDAAQACATQLQAAG